jgi:putative transposase
MSDARYRRKVLVGEIAEALRCLHYEKAQELDSTIEALEIMPDHVHPFTQSDPSEAPQRLANPFKGYTSRRLRLKYPQLRSRLASMWSRSY